MSSPRYLELEWFAINDNTKPSFETSVAKWYLIKRGEHYAVWRWDSKQDETRKMFVLTNIHNNNIVFDDLSIEGIQIKFEACERTYNE